MCFYGRHQSSIVLCVAQSLFTLSVSVCDTYATNATDATNGTYYFRYLQTPTSFAYIEFQIRASESAILGLSPQPYDVDPMYDIDIGSTGNTGTLIRRCKLVSRNNQRNKNIN